MRVVSFCLSLFDFPLCLASGAVVVVVVVVVVAVVVVGPTIMTRYAELLKPIRDLAENWNVDVARELERYLDEVWAEFFTRDSGRPCSHKQKHKQDKQITTYALPAFELGYHRC